MSTAYDFVLSFLEKIGNSKIREKAIADWEESKVEFLSITKLTDEEEFLKRVEIAAEKGATRAFNEKSNGKAEKKDKKKKKKKADGAPKNPLNGYILFSTDKRAEVKAENPEMKTTEISSLLGKMWKKIKEEDSYEYRKYMYLAKEDKVRYESEMKSYIPEDTDTEKVEKVKKKREKSAWQYFSEEMRPKLKEEGFIGRDVTSELSKRWKQLNDTQKSKYKKVEKKAEVQSESETEEVEVENESESEEEEEPIVIKKKKKANSLNI